MADFIDFLLARSRQGAEDTAQALGATLDVLARTPVVGPALSTADYWTRPEYIANRAQYGGLTTPQDIIPQAYWAGIGGLRKGTELLGDLGQLGGGVQWNALLRGETPTQQSIADIPGRMHTVAMAEKLLNPTGIPSTAMFNPLGGAAKLLAESSVIGAQRFMERAQRTDPRVAAELAMQDFEHAPEKVPGTKFAISAAYDPTNLIGMEVPAKLAATRLGRVPVVGSGLRGAAAAEAAYDTAVKGALSTAGGAAAAAIRRVPGGSWALDLSQKAAEAAFRDKLYGLRTSFGRYLEDQGIDTSGGVWQLLTGQPVFAPGMYAGTAAGGASPPAAGVRYGPGPRTPPPGAPPPTGGVTWGPGPRKPPPGAPPAPGAPTGPEAPPGSSPRPVPVAPAPAPPVPPTGPESLAVPESPAAPPGGPLATPAPPPPAPGPVSPTASGAPAPAAVGGLPREQLERHTRGDIGFALSGRAKLGDPPARTLGQLYAAAAARYPEPPGVLEQVVQDLSRAGEPLTINKLVGPLDQALMAAAPPGQLYDDMTGWTARLHFLRDRYGDNVVVPRDRRGLEVLGAKGTPVTEWTDARVRQAGAAPPPAVEAPVPTAGTAPEAVVAPPSGATPPPPDRAAQLQQAVGETQMELRALEAEIGRRYREYTATTDPALKELQRGNMENQTAQLRQLQDRLNQQTAEANALTQEVAAPQASFEAGQAPTASTAVSEPAGLPTIPPAAPPISGAAGEPAYPTSPRTQARGERTGRTYDFEFQVVPLDSLIPSHVPGPIGGLVENPAFPPRYQPRDLTEAAKALRVQQISNRFVPEQVLADTAELSRGPQLVSPENYVEAGNTRTLALQRLRDEKPADWAAYQAELRRRLPEYGLPPDAAEGIVDPVVIRRRVSALSDAEHGAYIAEANRGGVMELTTSEAAKEDARLLDDAIARSLLPSGGDLGSQLRTAQNVPAITQWMGTLGVGERPAMVSGTQGISAQGVTRFGRALFNKTYEGSVGATLAQALDQQMLGKLGAALEDASISLYRLKGTPYDLSADLAAAAAKNTQLRQNNYHVADYLQNLEMFERDTTPFQEALMQFLDRNSGSQLAMRDTLKEYARLAEEAAQTRFTAQADLAPERTKGELLDAARQGKDLQAGFSFAAAEAATDQAPAPGGLGGAAGGAPGAQTLDPYAPGATPHSTPSLGGIPLAEGMMEVRLPRSLAGGGQSMGKWNLSFASDVDKGLYILSQARLNPTKKAQYVAWLQAVIPLDQLQIQGLASEVRQVIARQAVGATGDLLQVPRLWDQLVPRLTGQLPEQVVARAAVAAPSTGTATYGARGPLIPTPAAPGGYPTIESYTPPGGQFGATPRLLETPPGEGAPALEPSRGPAMPGPRGVEPQPPAVEAGPPVTGYQPGVFPPPPLGAPSAPLGGARGPVVDFVTGGTVPRPPVNGAPPSGPGYQSGMFPPSGPPGAPPVPPAGTPPTGMPPRPGRPQAQIFNEGVLIQGATTPEEAVGMIQDMGRFVEEWRKAKKTVDDSLAALQARGLQRGKRFADTVKTASRDLPMAPETAKLQQVQRAWPNVDFQRSEGYIMDQALDDSFLRARAARIRGGGAPPKPGLFSNAWDELMAVDQQQLLAAPSYAWGNIIDAMLKPIYRYGQLNTLADVGTALKRHMGELIHKEIDPTIKGAVDRYFENKLGDTTPAEAIGTARHGAHAEGRGIRRVPVAGEIVGVFPAIAKAGEEAGRKMQYRTGYMQFVQKNIDTLATDVGKLVDRSGAPAGVGDGVAQRLRQTEGIFRPEEFVQLLDATGVDTATRDAALRRLGDYRRGARTAGIDRANEIQFNYRDVTNADEFARRFLLFHLFASRNIPWYIETFATHPGLWRAMKAYEDETRRMAEEGGWEKNPRLQGALPIPGGQAMGNLLFGRNGLALINPARYGTILQTITELPQERKGETQLGRALDVARTLGFGLARPIDIAIQALGTYGNRPPQSLLRVEPMVEAGYQGLGGTTATPVLGGLGQAYGIHDVLQRQRIGPWATPESIPQEQDYAVRTRLAEMSLERTGHRNAPEYVLAMEQGPGNPLYDEAYKQVGRQQLIQRTAGWAGLPLSFQSDFEARIPLSERGIPPVTVTGGVNGQPVVPLPNAPPGAMPLTYAQRDRMLAERALQQQRAGLTGTAGGYTEALRTPVRLRLQGKSPADEKDAIIGAYLNGSAVRQQAILANPATRATILQWMSHPRGASAGRP